MSATPLTEREEYPQPTANKHRKGSQAYLAAEYFNEGWLECLEAVRAARASALLPPVGGVQDSPNAHLAATPSDGGEWAERLYTALMDMVEHFERVDATGETKAVVDRAITVLAAPTDSASSIDQTADVAGALERNRAAVIADTVAALADQFEKDGESRNFACGFALAAEEIAHRIRTEEWTATPGASSIDGQRQEAVPNEKAPVPASSPVAPQADLAHEIWSAAQLGPGEGITDGVDRIAALLAPQGEPVAETQGVRGWAQGLNAVALKLRARYASDQLSTPLWQEFERCRNKMAQALAAPQGDGLLRQALEENERLSKLINSPQTEDWVQAVRLEAAHQQERWGSEHDAGKEDADWFWLLGFLGGKALASFAKGDQEKGLHHIVSSSAALLNWHRASTGEQIGMRPGIDGDAALPSTTKD